jgi:hypothetical protein
MAKRGRKSVDGKKSPAKGSCGAAAAPDAGTTSNLMEASTASGSARCRQLNRHNSDEVVERGMDKHFGHFPKTAVEAVVDSEGRTLRTRVKEERKNIKEQTPNGRLGAKFWADMMATYSAKIQAKCSNEKAVLVVKDKTMRFSEELDRLLKLATHSKQSSMQVLCCCR